MLKDTSDDFRVAARVAADVTIYDKLVVAKNIATNARLFCVLLAVANIAGGHPAMAVFAAMPIGLSCLVDQISLPTTKVLMSTLTYVFAAAVALYSILLLW